MEKLLKDAVPACVCVQLGCLAGSTWVLWLDLAGLGSSGGECELPRTPGRPGYPGRLDLFAVLQFGGRSRAPRVASSGWLITLSMLAESHLGALAAK